MNVHMGFEGPSVFLDATNPERARAGLGAVPAQLPRPRHQDLLARRGRARVRRVRLRQLPLPLRSEPPGRQPLPAGLLAGLLRGPARRRPGRRRQPRALRVGGQPALRRPRVVGRHPLHLRPTCGARSPPGIHMGVAGIPWFTTDIGGFHDGDIDDPDFHELLVRWFQFGTFCPVMRMHGDRKPHEPVVAADGSQRCRERRAQRAVELRRRRLPDPARATSTSARTMRPYTRAVMAAAHEDGQPVMRGLFHDFPDDPVCWDVADQFMFGPDLLVAPVLAPGRDLPEGLPARRRAVDEPAHRRDDRGRPMGRGRGPDRGHPGLHPGPGTAAAVGLGGRLEVVGSAWWRSWSTRPAPAPRAGTWSGYGTDRPAVVGPASTMCAMT